MTSSKVLMFLALAFIAGVFLASFLPIPLWLLYELSGLGAFYCLLFWRERAVMVFGLCLVIFCLGVWRFNYFLPNQNQTFLAGKSQNESAASPVLKEKIKELITQSAPSPQADILAGILMGDQGTISFEWKKKMNVSGTRHITAVSGMNIVILAEFLVWIGIILGLWRQQALAAAIFFVWCYIIFIGFPASAVRAGVMGSLLLLAGILSRQSAAERAVILAAAVMLAINPTLLAKDWGFQLSFAATLGIVYLTPFFQFWLNKIKIFRFAGLAGILAMNFSAQLFTLPILVYNFGSFSLVSVLSNVLIAPLIVLIMVFGFIFVLIGLFWPALGFVFSWPCQLLLNYLVWVIDFCSRLPYAALRTNFSLLLVFAIYSWLIFLAWRLRREKQYRFLDGF